jgi:pilus assembly protein CpaB
MDALELVGTVRDWLRRLGLHRRALAATLAGLAVFAGLSAVAPRPIPSAQVWVAARDLAGGQPLRTCDVGLRRLP